jgi:hypothetical protein
MRAQAVDERAPPPFWSAGYLVDYALTGAGLYVGVLADIPPGSRARIGPSFDSADPLGILDPAYNGTLGRTFTRERDWTVSDAALRAGVAGHLLLIPIHEAVSGRATGRPLTLHRLHHSVLSATEATAAAAALTRIGKAWAGRLRPDFQDRVRHVYCSQPDPSGSMQKSPGPAEPVPGIQPLAG